MSTTTGLTIPFVGVRKQYHNLRSQILEATDEVLRSGQLMNGNHTAEFENWLCRRNTVKYAITCHSGTQALEIIARFYYAQCEIDQPPTVLIPAVTFVATANAFAAADWNIHFVDVDSHGIMDHRKIPQSISYQAVVLVGLYGAAVTHWGNKNTWSGWNINDTVVIEDAAQHWLSDSSVRIGQAAAISFDPTKNLACSGNGGAVLTNDSALANFARSWRDNGRNYNHSTPASNSRISEIDAAHMMIKTGYIDQWQARRAKIAEFWCERLANSSVRCLIDASNSHSHGLQKFVIDCDRRDHIRQRLTERKIETKIHYEHPLHELSGIFSQYQGPGMLSAASALSRRVLSLPFFPELTDLEVEYITDQLLDLCA